MKSFVERVKNVFWPAPEPVTDTCTEIKIYEAGDGKDGALYYRIPEYGDQVGFFCEVIFTLLRMKFADERGFIPYIDWKKGHLYYEEGGMRGVENVYDYYFKQPSGATSLESLRFVTDATDEQMHMLQHRYDHHGYHYTDEYIDVLADMAAKYLVFNEETEGYLKDAVSKTIAGKKTLGVHFRGTDYRRSYNNHPVFVTVEDEIEKIKAIASSGGYERIFLATDEAAAIEKFREVFGDKLVYYEDVYRAGEGDDESVAYSKSSRENHHYLLGLEALRDQYTLSACDGMVCGLSNLSITARLFKRGIFKEEYKDLVILDKGTNQNNKAFCDASH